MVKVWIWLVYLQWVVGLPTCTHPNNTDDVIPPHSVGRQSERGSGEAAALNVSALCHTWNNQPHLVLQPPCPHTTTTTTPNQLLPCSPPRLKEGGCLATDLRPPLGASVPRARSSRELRIEGRSYSPSDVLMQLSQQGERWTLMNKYEDNLHLCCTFSLPIPHMVLLKRGMAEGEKSCIFKREPLGTAFVYMRVLGLCLLCVCVCARWTITLCVSPSECVRRRWCCCRCVGEWVLGEGIVWECSLASWERASSRMYRRVFCFILRLQFRRQ